MADSIWLRAFGQRSNTAPRPTPSDDHNPNKGPHHNQSHSPAPAPPARPVHRVSSLLSLDLQPTGGIAAPSRSPTTDSSPETETEPEADEPTITVREADRTWSNPSLDQVVEALQVAMMTKRDALVALPVEYNWHVLALVEGYAAQRRRIAELEGEVARLRVEGEGERGEVRAVAEEWGRREERYRAEVRRLELVIAKTSRDGMETVAMARSGSLVDRKGGKGFRERVKRLSGEGACEGDNYEISQAEPQIMRVGLSRARGSFRTIDSIPRTIDPDQDVMLSEQLLEEDSSTHDHHLKRRQYGRTRAEVMRQASVRRGASSIPEGRESSPQTTQAIVQDDLDITPRPGQGIHYQIGIDSSSSSSSSSTESPESQRSHGYCRRHDEIVGDTGRDKAGPGTDDNLSPAQRQATDQTAARRFSFNAGDDKVLTFSPPKAKVW